MSGNESKGSFASASPQTARVSSDGGSASGGAQASGSDDVEGEEQEESSSSNNGDLNIQSALATFRQKWQQELETESQHEIQSSSCLQNHSNAPQSTELQARNLFLRGVENERDGKLYEAIQFYRRAVQLVPDIEFQLYEASKFKSRDKQEAENVEDHVSADEHQNVNPKLDDDDDDDANLLTRIQKVFNDTLCVCEPQYEPKFELIDLRCSGNVTQSRFLYSFMRDCQEDAFPLCATHISVLPMEIILYILRWVVSSDLDMRSLEVCSRVCRGFYLCSRDPEIWKLACARVWGVNLGKLAHYESWRQMFIKRPRVHFGGCYISKATYIRHGENNFQDQFYRPWHLVEYYRYLRFFPEGLVLMLTTPDEPITGLCHLKHRVPKNAAVLTGHYRLHEDRVVLVLHRQEAASKTTLNNRYRNRRRENIQDVDEQTFHLELQIRSYRGRIHVQLVWQQHSVLTRYRNGHESKTTFDLPANRYPSLWFSRVKSYTAESEMPLQ